MSLVPLMLSHEHLVFTNLLPVKLYNISTFSLCMENGLYRWSGERWLFIGQSVEYHVIRGGRGSPDGCDNIVLVQGDRVRVISSSSFNNNYKVQSGR